MPSLGEEEDEDKEKQEVMGEVPEGAEEEGGGKVSVPLCGRVRRCVN